MKKTILTLSFVFFAMLSSNAQALAQTKSTATDNTNAPVITFESKVHDYGTVKKGADGNCIFTFKNTGKEPLILINVSTSWGCTIPAWPKEPILPGKSGVIKVNYTKTNAQGAISKNITVTSNAKNSTEVLSLKGTVVDDTNTGTLPEKQPNQIATPPK